MPEIVKAEAVCLTAVDTLEPALYTHPMCGTPGAYNAVGALGAVQYSIPELSDMGLKEKIKPGWMQWALQPKAEVQSTPDERVDSLEPRPRRSGRVLRFLNDDLRKRARQIGGEGREAVYATMLDELAGVEDRVDPTHGWGSKYGAIEHNVEEALAVLQQGPAEEKPSLPGRVRDGLQMQSYLRGNRKEKGHQALPFELLGYPSEEARKIVEEISYDSTREQLKKGGMSAALHLVRANLLTGAAVAGALCAIKTPEITEWLAQDPVRTAGAIAASYLAYGAGLWVGSVVPDKELLEKYGTCTTIYTAILHSLDKAVDPRGAKKRLLITSFAGTFVDTVKAEIEVGLPVILGGGIAFGEPAAALVGSGFALGGILCARAGAQEAAFRIRDRLQESRLHRARNARSEEE